ncbi:MAG TPA: hypothetical protein VNN79_25475 [Actinomycetota bacterium]|nr:hypothetical protein [Actinomycetota bacterium]
MVVAPLAQETGRGDIPAVRASETVTVDVVEALPAGTLPAGPDMDRVARPAVETTREALPSRVARDVLGESDVSALPLDGSHDRPATPEPVLSASARSAVAQPFALPATPIGTDRRSIEPSPTRRTRGRRGESAREEPAPVRVTIGRVEVRAAPPVPAPTTAPAEPTGPDRFLSLDDYLRRRAGDER